MPQYLIRFDRGPSERFEAVSLDAARDYVREILLDEGAEEGDGGCLYLVDEGGRGDEEFVAEVRLGDDAGDDEQARDDATLLRCDQCGRLGLAWFFPVICSPERLCADCA